jgi:hypothetical protein
MNVFLNLNYDKRYPDICNLDIYVPDTEMPCPVFIYFHGGGLESGSKEDNSEDLKKITMHNIALVSVEYRKYPQAKYPDYIEDAAKAIDFIFKYNIENNLFSDYFIGGSSAGAYLSMMLYFDHRYLSIYGINVSSISGWFFDAGQPSVHFRVLSERGLDPRMVRVDEAAPLYFVSADIDTTKQGYLMFVVAENDVEGRLEQTQLLLNTMKQFKYDMSRITFKFMKGCAHCEYPIQDVITSFIVDSLKNT